MTDYDKYWIEKGEYGRIRIERKRLRKNKRKNRPIKSHKCSQCNYVSESVIEEVVNPYYKDMNGVEVMEWLCGSCYDAALGDI